MPTAMGRSKRPPSFGKSAGDKLTVMRPGGKLYPAVNSAERTRSLLSNRSLGKYHHEKRRQAGPQVRLDSDQWGRQAGGCPAQDGADRSFVHRRCPAVGLRVIGG